MSAVSPEAKARRREYARKSQFLHYHMRRLTLATKEEMELEAAIEHARARSQPRHVIILLYEKLKRAQDAIVAHRQALSGGQARTYTKTQDYIVHPELEAFLAEVKDPSLKQMADTTALDAEIESDPALAEMIKQWTSEQK